MTKATPDSVLQRMFSGLTESTFQSHLGVADPALVDYLSDLLVRFVRCDAVFRVRSVRGKRLQQVAEMLGEAEARVGEARREVHRHIGDYTLFWTGLYPEALEKSRNRKDDLLDYTQQGKRAYFIASTMSDSRQKQVFTRLSDEFEMCAYGLNEVRREWERGDDGEPFRPLIVN